MVPGHIKSCRGMEAFYQGVIVAIPVSLRFHGYAVVAWNLVFTRPEIAVGE
jgi:hypothetical protein